MFPQIFGKYVLEREIAAGGMARVFLATLRGAEGFEKRLVVKQIRPELAADPAFVQRFVGEAKTAVELSHPNIVPVFELGVEQGVYYIAMEYCPGVTLADVLFETGPLEPEEGAYVGAEVCRALDYAHRRASIVHRDVTPRNVLVDDEGAIRLIDFGIAAPVDAGSGRAREVFGSPGHMPPEQLRGEDLGPQADVFAVAALLVEAWTGTPPFRRATPRASAEALKQPPPRVDTTLTELAQLAGVIEASLALEAVRRPASAEELGQKLREFLRSADPVAIARRLAARVQRLRTVQRRSTESSRSEDRASAGDTAESGQGPKAPSVRAPSAAHSVTRTFAAREELVVWTRRLSSAPPPSGGTVRVPSPPSTPPRSGSVPVRRRRASFVALAVLALVLVAAGSFAMFGRRADSPVSAPEMGSRAPATRIAPRENVAPTAERVVPPPRAAPATKAPARRVPVISSGRPSQLPPRSELQPSSSPAAASAPAPVVSATLRLSADPPAVVSIEGEGVQQTSSTPVRGLSLRPGAYRVTFRNETYGAPVATRVVLEPGGERSVHADFRSAEPRVTQR